MITQSSLNDVFRFVHLRPPIAQDSSLQIQLLPDTELAVGMSTSGASERVNQANEALSDHSVTIQAVEDLHLGEKILAALNATLASKKPTLTLFHKNLGAHDPYEGNDFAEDRRRLSDTLLAIMYATEAIPDNVSTLQDLYRAYDLTHRHVSGEKLDIPLETFMLKPILLPFDSLLNDSSRESRVRNVQNQTSDLMEAANLKQGSDVGSKLITAIQELEQLDYPGLLVQPTSDGRAPDNGQTPFTLTDQARGRLSQETHRVLQEIGIDLNAAPIHSIINQLAEHGQVAAVQTSLMTARSLIRSTDRLVILQEGEIGPRPKQNIRPIGIADLLVVKQQIKRYEAGEIAHSENIMAGETKSRTHRQLERTEETFITEIETTTEQKTELETAERFELNRETSRTIKQDQQIGFGLSLSGKYGPTVEFSSNFELKSNKSVEDTAKTASSYAKNVVERSLEHVTERIREERIRKVIREQEETNLHELRNNSQQHISGLYQFLDKVYEAQVFSYGLREMFDFMIPEPAHYLWQLEHPTRDVSLPDPPERLTISSALQIDEWNYASLAAKYGVTDVEPPPARYKMVSVGSMHGGEGTSEKGRPRVIASTDITIPDNYQARRAIVRWGVLTDSFPAIAITIGSQSLFRNFYPDGGDELIPVGEDKHKMAVDPKLYASLEDEAYQTSNDAKLNVSIVAWETNTFTVTVNVVCQRTATSLDEWRLKTYQKIRQAYEERVREYEERVQDLIAEAEAKSEATLPFGAPPSQNLKTIMAELKKHCISIITQQRYETFDAIRIDQNDSLYIDFDEAETEGSFIRFFEQAFEWDQMQYVFYPYYWARASTWAERFRKNDTDPQFLEFLQAGAARVVVPVRPGFETAMMHYIETGKLWDGRGDPPEISSPLYVSIVDEIKERTGASKGEVAVGDPWEVRLPTSLVMLRQTNDLPAWKQVPDNSWQWRPA